MGGEREDSSDARGDGDENEAAAAIARASREPLGRTDAAQIHEGRLGKVEDESSAGVRKQASPCVVQLPDRRDVDLASNGHDCAAMEPAFRYQQKGWRRRLQGTRERQAGKLARLASLVDEWRMVSKGSHRCFHRRGAPPLVRWRRRCIYAEPAPHAEVIYIKERTMTLDVRSKRIYDPPDGSDGYRVLIDDIWPRGVSRERAWREGVRQWARTAVTTPWPQLARASIL
jgi:hypothetical protein